jgi:hypothetical protein
MSVFIMSLSEEEVKRIIDGLSLCKIVQSEAMKLVDNLYNHNNFTVIRSCFEKPFERGTIVDLEKLLSGNHVLQNSKFPATVLTGKEDRTSKLSCW